MAFLIELIFGDFHWTLVWLKSPNSNNSVYVLNRIDNYCTVRKIKYESLGANAMTLANDIFENVEIQPFFQKEIKRMIYDGLSEDEIIKNMKSFEDMNLDIGINSLIHYMVKERNEKD